MLASACFRKTLAAKIPLDDIEHYKNCRCVKPLEWISNGLSAELMLVLVET
jgi:hypothetical protein